MDFVTGVFFEGACSLDRGKFYPERRKIRSLITYVKMETRFSKMDQENVQHSVSSCREAKIHFTPRQEYLFKSNIPQSFRTVNII